MQKFAHKLTRHSLIVSTVSCIILSLSGCVIHVGGNGRDGQSKGDVSSIFGEASVSKGKSVGDVSSVNGGIELNDDVNAKKIHSVNGDIEINQRVTVQSIDIVNGDIETGMAFTAHGNIESVNGDIDIDSKGHIAGNIVTVNGDIELRETYVDSNLNTTNGSLSITHGSLINGDIVYESVKQRSWSRNSLPTLRIDNESNVNGAIILHRPVNLEIENSELRMKVQRYYSQG
jgi:hypothetical protein